MTTAQEQARAELVAAGRELLAAGLVARTWGNLSLRLPGGRMAVTPSGIEYPDLTPEMIVVVDLATGEWAGDFKPTSERKVHAEIYRTRPEVQAVVHTHQNAASACAAVRRPVPTAAGLVPCAAYGLPGTKKLTAATVGALADGDSALMANHGVIAVGDSLDAAFGVVAELERECADHLSRLDPDLPARVDEPWQPQWTFNTVLADGTPALVSRAPFTAQWVQLRQPLPAVLDDLAQICGPRLGRRDRVPGSAPRTGAVLLDGLGVLLTGDDALATALVVEKAARAVIAGAALGGARPLPWWEAQLMHAVYQASYAKQAAKGREPS